MNKSKVFFTPVSHKSQWSQVAKHLLGELIDDNKIKLESELPLKIHTGEPGNTAFIQPKYMDGIIDYLEESKVKGIFMETNMANGGRTDTKVHIQVAKDHGFTRLPFVVADGDEDNEHVLVPIKGKHFKKCKIAPELDKHNQVIIISHFKGHVMTGFGGAIKMLGIGFASKQGKTEAHSKVKFLKGELIDWDKAVTDGDWDAKEVKWNEDYVYHGKDFIERVAEYALAAKKPGHIHIVFATNLVKDCDCDGKPMDSIYEDIGVFASLDSLAIDKAILDMLDKREGEKTYWGRYIFDYGEKIGLGNKEYELIEIEK